MSPAPKGRPTVYNEELANRICDLLANTSDGLSRICLSEEMPHRATVHRWIVDNKDFRDKYACAREAQADLLADQIIEIADDTSDDILYTELGQKENSEFINRSKVRIDARKWKASKLNPKVYGDKTVNENTNINKNINVEISPEEAKSLKDIFDDKF